MAQLGDIAYLEYEVEEYFRQRLQKVMEYQRLKYNFRVSDIIGIEDTMGVLFFVFEGNLKFTEDELKDMWVEMDGDEEPTDLIYPQESELATQFEQFLFSTLSDIFGCSFTHIVIEEINKVLGYGQER